MLLNIKIMIETWWNITYNFLSVLMPLFFYFTDEQTFMNNIRSKLINVHYSYYSFDIVWEILYYNRFVYIPHHIFTLYLFYLFKNEDYSYYELKNMIWMFSLLEYTTLFSNIRDHLKKVNKLDIKFDVFMYLQFLLIRIFYFTYFTYYYLFSFFKSSFPKILTVCLISMSYYWFYLWSKTIKKKLKKN